LRCKDQSQLANWASIAFRTKSIHLPTALNFTALARFKAKWTPVRVKKARQNRVLKFDSDSIRAGFWLPL
jgi:hypothetical protein